MDIFAVHYKDEWINVRKYIFKNLFQFQNSYDIVLWRNISAYVLELLFLIFFSYEPVIWYILYIVQVDDWFLKYEFNTIINFNFFIRSYLISLKIYFNFLII